MNLNRFFALLNSKECIMIRMHYNEQINVLNLQYLLKNAEILKNA
ncbi:Uncharacterised protein [Legionella moravica]|uniref:Uncharacterized protein n=1 Tax=Legionella moravica TaxID=39962 RepID=A0A378JY73_9GAMM|nr:Uncharacterised protein [Legionella moravica]